MRNMTFFFSLFVIFSSCSLKQPKDEDIKYITTAHKFISLLKESKLDSAKKMFLFYPEDSTNINERIRASSEMLHESAMVPNIRYFELDTITILNPATKHFAVEIFRNEERNVPSGSIGKITIGFRKGFPDKIYTVSTRLSKRHSKF